MLVSVTRNPPLTEVTMTNHIRLCLALHNHQPVGNFESVLEQAYQDSYLPFLDVFESYPDLRLSLHTSGPLMEWLESTHEDYVDRLADLVAADRIEILGGAFYEPILTMIPRRDRIGQIRRYTAWLESRLGGRVRGMWVPERVWEQSLTSDLVDAGMRYTLLDDFHFRNAGLSEDQLHGYYVTEDEGRLLTIFPGSEHLRYTVPFADPQQSIDYLGHVNAHHPGAVVVFGDDGEKFGTWPETKQHVYGDGWLRRFFELLLENQHWIKVTTLSEALTSTPPLGKVYLPEGSYREMTEWALPTSRQIEYDGLVREMESDPRWQRIRPFVRGGYWRNFKAKYPESNEMYSRMMMVSRRLEEVSRNGGDAPLIDAARRELYRGQCNCSYWHGAFGGIYIPHLRHAVYNHLIAADNLLDQAIGKVTPWVEASVDDYDFDARQEIQLSNEHLVSLIAPARGGQLYELDVRSICLNLLATVARRKEAYHGKILAGAGGGNGEVASIHERVVFKQEGLDQRLQYDIGPRKSLLDRFYGQDATLESVSRGEAEEKGDFVIGSYDAKLRRNPDRIQVVL
jgi:alpha-amylase